MKIKAKKLFNIKNMTREEWLECRQNGIGGSDVSAIVGLNKYKSALNVYIEKTEELPEQTENDNEYIYWGNILEDVVAKEFKTRNEEYKVQRSSFMWQHVEHPFMVANVDRLIYKPEAGWGVLEIKTASEYRDKDFVGDVIPEEYLLQVMHYLAVMNLDYGYLAVLVGGNKYKQFRIDRDEELIESLIELERSFWVDNVLAGVPPEMDGSDACSDLLKTMYVSKDVRDKNEVIELPESAEELIEQYEKARELEKQALELKAEAGNKLKEKLGNFQVGLVNGRKLSWTSFEKSYFDKNALAAAYPDLVAKYTEKRPDRRFTIGKAKVKAKAQ